MFPRLAGIYRYQPQGRGYKIISASSETFASGFSETKSSMRKADHGLKEEDGTFLKEQ
jgi:hypothetical protein